MEIKQISEKDDLWQKTIDYGRNCSWKAGKYLAENMEKNKFIEWERVFVALDKGNIAGYCTFVKRIVFQMLIIHHILVVYL